MRRQRHDSHYLEERDLTASAAPPHLVAIFPYVTASEYYNGWTYQSGAFMRWLASSWTTGLAEDTLRRKAEALAQRAKWVQQLPIENYKLLSFPGVGDLASYYRDWVEHERSDDYWGQRHLDLNSNSGAGSPNRPLDGQPLRDSLSSWSL